MAALCYLNSPTKLSFSARQSTAAPPPLLFAVNSGLTGAASRFIVAASASNDQVAIMQEPAKISSSPSRIASETNVEELSFLAVNDPRTALRKLVEHTRSLGSPGSLHVVAFSGGVDSSLVAFLLSQAFPPPPSHPSPLPPSPASATPPLQASDAAPSALLNPQTLKASQVRAACTEPSGRGTPPAAQPADSSRLRPPHSPPQAGVSLASSPPPSGGVPPPPVVACIGCSPSLPAAQLALARRVARHIGIPLWEVPTSEGLLPGYVANAGASCFFCKATLYATLRGVAEGALRRSGGAGEEGPRGAERESTREGGGGEQQHAVVVGVRTQDAPMEAIGRSEGRSGAGEAGEREERGEVGEISEIGEIGEAGEDLKQTLLLQDALWQRLREAQAAAMLRGEERGGAEGPDREVVRGGQARDAISGSDVDRRESDGQGRLGAGSTASATERSPIVAHGGQVAAPSRRRSVPSPPSPPPPSSSPPPPSPPSPPIVLFNGTNADDLRDPSRVGLLAALQCRVASPLAGLSKEAVRTLAREAGLPNWDAAASPCLRSRLAVGVPATAEALGTVERAEEMVRSLLPLQPSSNLRLRVLPDSAAIVEVDPPLLPLLAGEEVQRELRGRLEGWGLRYQGCRPFKSGSVARKE